MAAATATVHRNGVNNCHPGNPVFGNSPTFQMACRQLASVAEHIDLDKGVLERLSVPKRALIVSIPIVVLGSQIVPAVGLPPIREQAR